MARAMGEFVDGFERVPVVLLPALIRHRAPTPTEGGSVYPAVQNLLLAARGLGYGGVVTMFHGFVEDELREVLGVPDDVGLAATIALGRPIGGHGPVRRRPLAHIVFDDRWGDPAPWAVEPAGAEHTAFDRPS
jgi:nitroreductase